MRSPRQRLARVYAETRAAEARRMTVNGTVVRLLPDKGFGFIRDDHEIEYFFHRSACEDFDRLDVGSAVVFVATEAPKGPRAESVVRA